MEIGTLLAHLFANSVTAASIYGLCLLFAVDFVTGVARAIADSTFDIRLVDVWARTKGTRLVAVLIVLIAGAVSPDIGIAGFQFNALTALGVGFAATVAAAELASIADNLNKLSPNPKPTE